MGIAISNTSPLLFLDRIGGIIWLPHLFDVIWTPGAVLDELKEGRQRGYHVCNPLDYGWFKVVEPEHLPSEWMALDLGPGEMAAMALALENPVHTVLLDDNLARRTAQAAGLNVWGTLRILLEAKAHGLTEQIAPLIVRLEDSGMWISPTIRHRILVLASES